MGVATISLVAPLLLAGADHIQAATILIDFEQFSDRYNLNGINLGGVTLTNPSGNVEVHDNRFGVGYHSATKAIASPNGLVSVNPLVGVFDNPVSYVGLWGGDAGTYVEPDSWELLAYDARIGGNLVGRVSSGSWNGSPYRQLSLSAASILRFEAIWTGPQFGIGYDDLKFVTAAPPPPPTTFLPSNGSLDEDALTIDFGSVPAGAASALVFFDLWNLAATGPTADLNLVNLAGSGDTGVFITDLTPFAGLTPSSSRSFSASIDTSKPGEYSAIVELFVSDTTGTPQSPLKIAFTGSVVPEPSAIVLAAVGLLCVLAWGRRRRRAA
jgi:uncharacterized protein (TIGR03382 family)